jgi:hypothetical protein
MAMDLAPNQMEGFFRSRRVSYFSGAGLEGPGVPFYPYGLFQRNTMIFYMLNEFKCYFN